MFKTARKRMTVAGSLAGATLIWIAYALSLFNAAGWIFAMLIAAAGSGAVGYICARLYELSITDEGTGLYNRRFIFRKLSSEMSRTLKSGGSLGLVVIDVDDFRRYNNSYGHLAGDKVLLSVARTLRSGIRKGDIIGRWGGEEFAIILPGADTGEAFIVAERLRGLIAQMYVDIGMNANAETTKVRVTISAGVASFPVDGVTVRDLVNRADEAMYAAKQQKNRVFPYMATS